ncbi:30S ribosomal protein S6 [Haloferula helveola]|uniref:Small ribosomal subunit protein bS6 n=1 Tax=Haloferula helveola TaxID=490095 RepID=A0ABM7RCW7_9BACT|nr:30S ribosomal protein S6 [Haloferula helveola]
MSRNYEGLIVLNTKGAEGSVDDLISSIGKEIEAEGGKLEEVRQLGRRQFAYPAKDIESGNYVNFLFSADPASLAKVQTRLKMNDAVHLQHYQTR